MVMHFSRPLPLCPSARPILIYLLGITNLLGLLPNKPGMPIYHTKCCTYLMSPSNQLSSSMDSSLTHSQHQQVTTMSLFNSVAYISRLLWTQIIQYRLCSCLDNSSSSNLHLATASCPGCTIPSEEDFVPGGALPGCGDTALKSPVSFSSQQS